MKLFSTLFVVLFFSLLLTACGKRKTEIVYRDRIITPPQEERTKTEQPTCDRNYTDSYYDLKLKIQVLKYAGTDSTEDWRRKSYDEAYDSYFSFTSFFNVKECTVLEFGKLRTIVTDDVILDAHNIITAFKI